MRMSIIGISCLLSSIVLQPAYGQQAPGGRQAVAPPPPGATGQGAPPALTGSPAGTANLSETLNTQQREIERLRYENTLLRQKIHLLEQLLSQQGDRP